MIEVGPVPRFAGSSSEIEFPIIRDMDRFMYERQHGTGLEVGSYAHRPILHDPDEIPSIEASPLSPTELPFTEEDFCVSVSSSSTRASSSPRSATSRSGLGTPSTFVLGEIGSPFGSARAGR